MTTTTLVKVLVAMVAALYLGGCGCSVDDGAALGASSSQSAALSFELADADYVHDAKGTDHLTAAVRVNDPSLASVRVTLSVVRADGSALGSPSIWSGAPSRAIAGIDYPVDASLLADGEALTLRAVVTAPDGRFGEAKRTVQVHP